MRDEDRGKSAPCAAIAAGGGTDSDKVYNVTHKFECTPWEPLMIRM